MSLNGQPSGERLHIAFFGLRNAGKSSVVNSLTGQNLSIVSPIKGTTTDPVRKAMELLPLGPVMIIDTPGIDDEGDLGTERIKKALQILNKTDIGVLVVDSTMGLQKGDKELIAAFKKKQIPYVLVYNKSDLVNPANGAMEIAAIDKLGKNEIHVSAINQTNIQELKELIGQIAKQEESKKRIVGDLIDKNDLIVLVTPIDSAAPKGRLILPQQQTIRDILEEGAISLVTRETELEATLESLAKKPKMVITDSQAFKVVNQITPKEIPLTSFSILFARYKGNLAQLVKGAAVLDRIEDGDCILISEGCTHHRQCDDIGTVKLPGWIRSYRKKEIRFDFTSGGEFPEDLTRYRLIIHCGACMLTEREMKYRMGLSLDHQVPITNYGVAIAHVHGILKRSIELFPDIYHTLD